MQSNILFGVSIFFGGSVVAAVIAGAIALFAPCCVSVMLPAFFASAAQNRRVLVAMTFVFAAGVATVILPIALGAVTLRRLLVTEHTTIYTVGGLLLVALGAYTLLGGRVRLPMPGAGRPARSGPLGVYTLGVFSGVASSCCAPVLAGVVALSGVASSFGFALGLGAAYVFGMVAPLFVMSLLWDRYDLASSRLFRPRSFTWRVGPIRRTVTGTAIASGVLLIAMGGFALWIGQVGRSMPTQSGWQARLTSELSHYGHVVTDALDWIPGWIFGVALAVAVIALGRIALRQLGWIGITRAIDTDLQVEENLVEHQTQ